MQVVEAHATTGELYRAASGWVSRVHRPSLMNFLLGRCYENSYSKAVDTPYGPRKIGKQLQVAIPKELASRAHLWVGDQIYFLFDDERPDVLKIVPIDVVVRRLNDPRSAPAD